MSPRAILYPVLALVALTAGVAIVMYRRRVAEMVAKRIRPQAVATSPQMGALLENVTAADNYRNLHEAPVLFYAAALLIYAAKLTDPTYVALAWAYVAVRVAHTLIHTTYNRVIHRLWAFAASLGILWVLWALIAWDLLAAGRG
jgi:hypothetical protein